MTVTVGQLQQGGYVGQDDRNILGALLTKSAPATVLEGILPSDGTDFAVTAQGTPNMTLNVAKGDLVVPDASGGAYLLHNSATKVVTIDTAPVSGTRYDLIIARVYDNAAGDSSPTTTMAMAGATAGNATVQTVTGDIEVVKGTAGGSPSPPALPTTRCRVLKVVHVGTGVSSITNGDLSDSQGSASRLGNTAAAGGAIVAAGTSYTPALVQNVTVTKTVPWARYVIEGKRCRGNVCLKATAAGTAANSVTSSLPVAPAYTGSDALSIGSFSLIRASGARPAGDLIITGNSGVVLFQASGEANVVGQAPTTALASGDVLTFSFDYEIA